MDPCTKCDRKNECGGTCPVQRFWKAEQAGIDYTRQRTAHNLRQFDPDSPEYRAYLEGVTDPRD